MKVTVKTKRLYIFSPLALILLLTILFGITVSITKEFLPLILSACIYGVFLIIVMLSFVNMLKFSITETDSGIILKRLFSTKTIYYKDISKIRLHYARGLVCSVYGNKRKIFTFSIDMNQNSRDMVTLLMNHNIPIENIDLLK